MEENNLNNMNEMPNGDINNIQPNVGSSSVNNYPTNPPVAPVASETVVSGNTQTAVTPFAEQPTMITQETTNVPFTTATTQNMETNNLNNGNKKNKTGLFIILSLIAAVVIGVVIFFLLINKDESETKPEDKEPQKQENNPVVQVAWNGIYENESGKIILYKLVDNKLSFSLDIDDYSSNGTAEINGNSAEGEIFDTYTFVLNGDSLEFTTTDPEANGGTFTKTKDYTKEDYYTDNIGNVNYLENGLNGVFESNDVSITIYQTKEDRANLLIVKGSSSYQREVDIVNGRISYEDEFFEDIDSISASITEDTLTITASSTDSESLLNKVSGTYTRTKTLAIDDILNEGLY